MRKVPWLWMAYLLMIPVIFFLPHISYEQYDLVRHTTSQLAAQNTPNAWVMNLILVLLGLATILEGWVFLKTFYLHQIVLTVFGWSLIMTAVFQHAPIIETLAFDPQEDYLHSVFANLTGWTFTFFAVSAAFIEPTLKRKIWAMVTAVLALTLSVLFFNLPQYAGIWQRAMFLITFGWLLFFMHRRRKIYLSNWKALRH